LATSYSDIALISTEQDVDRVTAAATQAVYEFLLRRVSERYPKWTDGYAGRSDSDVDGGDGGKVVPLAKAG
jgi:hypothetical protein